MEYSIARTDNFHEAIKVAVDAFELHRSTGLTHSNPLSFVRAGVLMQLIIEPFQSLSNDKERQTVSELDSVLIFKKGKVSLT